MPVSTPTEIPEFPFADAPYLLHDAWCIGDSINVINANTRYFENQEDSQLSQDGGVLTGPLILAGDPVGGNEAASKNYVDKTITQLLSTKVDVCGDTMTGDLAINDAAPTVYFQDTNHRSALIQVDQDKFTIKRAIGANPLGAGVDSTNADLAFIPFILDLQTGATQLYDLDVLGSLDVAGATTIVGNTSIDGQVTIGNAASVNGDLLVYGQIVATQDITAFSDKRIKKNINTLEDALEKVLKLRGVTYQHKTTNKDSIGVIAQELQEVFPELVKEARDGTLAVAYGNLVGVLIEAVKTLNEKIEVLESKLDK